MCYMGRKDSIETVSAALEVFPEPFRTTCQTILQMCAYAGTGDVLIVQELLRTVGERVEVPCTSKSSETTSKTALKKEKEKKSKTEWDASIPQAMAVLGVALVSIGEEMGMEMVQRILGNAGRYGDSGKISFWSLASLSRTVAIDVVSPTLQIGRMWSTT